MSKELKVFFVFTVICMAIVSPCVQAAEIDKAGWEKIVRNPDTGEVLMGLHGSLGGYGNMAVFGPEARIVALYSAASGA